MEFVTDDTVAQIAQQNGAKDDVATFKDNRFRLVVDSKQIETWEVMVMEDGNLTKAMMVFARYLHRGDSLVSPELPSDPIDELPKAEIARIKESDAYKALKRFKMPQLLAAAKSFSNQANAGF